MDSRGPIEVALTSDLRGEPYNFALWDIHTGAQLVVFRGNKSNPIARCLQLINNDYFITASDNVLQVWSIYNRKCQEQKLFLPGRPSCLVVSPCGNYLVVGICEMIYIWQLNSGNLYSHTKRHYENVTVIKMSQDGAFLFSGGQDGMVLVWPFADLISHTHNTGALNLNQARRDTGLNEPRFTWQHHSAPVTDVHVTNGGRCITASVDKTINIYSYHDGKRLSCIANFPSPIWSVTSNNNETVIYLGGEDGNIYETSVSSLSLSVMNSRNTDELSDSRKPILSGHKNKVISLLVSFDGSMLISASLDSTCKIWDIYQGKLLRDVKHQAPLANLTSLMVPDAFALTSMTQSQIKPPLFVKPLKRNLFKVPRDNCVAREDLFEEASTTIVCVKNTREDQTYDICELPQASHMSAPNNDSDAQIQPENPWNPDLESPGALKNRLRKLYMVSVEKIFKDAADASLKPFEDLAKTKGSSKNTNGKKKKKGHDKPAKRKKLSEASSTSSERTETLTNGVGSNESQIAKKMKKKEVSSDIFV